MERVKSLLKADKPVKWLFHGDSITHGAFHTFGARDYTELFAERVRWELRRCGDLVLNSAYSGFTSRDLLADFDWRVGQFAPDVVFVMIGMNDCVDGRGGLDEFKENLRTLVGRIGGLAVLQTCCPILPNSAPEREPRYPAFMDAVQEVAAAEKLPLVDHHRHWLANSDKHFYWMNDAIHPNAAGHAAMAHHLFKCLDIFDAAAITCRLLVP